MPVTLQSAERTAYRTQNTIKRYEVQLATLQAELREIGYHEERRLMLQAGIQITEAILNEYKKVFADLDSGNIDLLSTSDEPDTTDYRQK